VKWARHEPTETRSVGRGRGGAHRPSRTAVQGRYVITGVERHARAMAARRHRLGWRGQGTKAPAHQLSLPEALGHSRGGWSLARDCHLVKDLPLGLSPLFVWTEDQIMGRTRLLTLALRLLTLMETQVRRELEQAQDPVAGLYEAQPTRTTERPPGKRILQAFARAKLTLTRVDMETARAWHLTSLSPLHVRLLHSLRLPVSLYTALADTS
jgi:transposase